MQRLLTRLAFLFLVVPSLAIGQAASPGEKPLETTICELSGHPNRFDGELIQVRGYVTRGFEDFTLHDSPLPFASSCKARIWLELGGDGKGPRNYMVVDTARLYNAPAEWQKQGQIDSVRLVKDQTFSEMMEKLRAFRSVQPGGTGCRGLRLCALYQVQATITGRFFQAHIAGRNNGQYFEGYGHMGCCHMLVIQQVTGLNAERTAVPEENQAFVCSTQTWKLTDEDAAELQKFEKIDACSPAWLCRWRQYFTKVAAHWNDRIEVEKGVIPIGFSCWISPDLTLEYSVVESAGREKKSKKREAVAVERKECKPVPAQPE